VTSEPGNQRAGGEAEAEAEDEDEEEEPVHLGHSAADSATTDEPEEPGVPHEVEYVDLVKIWNAPDRGAAKLVKGILEGADIPCVIEDDPGDVVDGLTGAQLDGIDVFVPAAYEARAVILLAQNGIATRIDPKLVEKFAAERLEPAAAAGDESLAPVAAELGEQAREFREAVLLRLAGRGRAGFDALRAVLRVALSEPENPLVRDIPRLVEAGHFGKEAPLAIVNDLARAASENDAKVRARAAAALGGIRGSGAAGTLVNLLADRDPAVRDEALESLYVLSDGEDFGFDPEADPGPQEKAILRWREWARDNPGA
jgi:hypothetical protein